MYSHTGGTVDLQETLLAFSEWLDGEGLMKTPKGKDKRTHEDLAREFIQEWESTDTRATLAGREPITGGQVALPLDMVPTTVGGRDSHSGSPAPHGRRVR